MQSCMRKIHFSYGHRVMDHKSKCATLHGHNGYIEVHAVPIDGLDGLGMVVDFAVLKERIGGWVEHHWDHTTILFKEDTETIDLIKRCPGQKEPYILDSNPTAENLASHLLWKVCPELLRDTGVIVNEVVVWETDNCRATERFDTDADIVRQTYNLPLK